MSFISQQKALGNLKCRPRVLKIKTPKPITFSVHNIQDIMFKDLRRVLTNTLNQLICVSRRRPLRGAGESLPAPRLFPLKNFLPRFLPPMVVAPLRPISISSSSKCILVADTQSRSFLGPFLWDLKLTLRESLPRKSCSKKYQEMRNSRSD